MSSSMDQTRNFITHPLDVPAAIQQRRSIKSFKSEPIAPETLKRLIELTVAAPSSWNLQDWRIVLIQDVAQKVALQAAAFNQSMITQAPITFVFAADAGAWKGDLSPIFDQALKSGAWNEGTVGYFKNAIPQFQQALGERNREYAIKDAMIAATHLTLAAESLGLSTCFMNGWIEEKVKEVIGATDSADIGIACLVPVGYAAEPRKNPGRLPYESNVFLERLDTPYMK